MKQTVFDSLFAFKQRSAGFCAFSVFSALALASFSPSAEASCSLAFTSPGEGSTVTTPSLTITGQGAGDAVHGNVGTVTATLNGVTIFNLTGSFTAVVSFFRSQGVPVQLRPGLNFFTVTGSVGGCSARDTMTVLFSPDVDLGKNKGGDPDGDPLNQNTPCKLAGNPIDFSTGNKFQAEEDYRRAGAFNALPLRFARSYNSLEGYWLHSYSTRLKLSPNRATLVFADGRESAFALAGAMATGSATEFGALAAAPSNAPPGNAWRYTSPANETHDFDSAGRLLRHSHPYGMHHQLAYAADGVVTVTDSFGNALSFTQDSRFQPIALSAPGIAIAYGRDVIGRLANAVSTTALGTKTRTYHYENAAYPRFLTGITDERGVRYATWAYDSQGRATLSEHAGGVGQTSIAYNANGTTTVTNPLGKQTVYHYSTIQGIKRIIRIEGTPAPNCPYTNAVYTYDSRAMVSGRTDNKGNLTQFAYDSRGRETQRIEAVGTPEQRITATTWHPIWALPLTISQPGRTISYSYDAQGRLLSQSVGN